MKFPPTITGSIHLGRAGDRAGAHGREPRPPWLRWLGTPRNALGLSALAAGVTAGTLLSLSMGAASPWPSTRALPRSSTSSATSWSATAASG